MKRFQAFVEIKVNGSNLIKKVGRKHQDVKKELKTTLWN